MINFPTKYLGKNRTQKGEKSTNDNIFMIAYVNPPQTENFDNLAGQRKI